MRHYKVNKIQHTVFDSEDEVPSNIHYLRNWKEASLSIDKEDDNIWFDTGEEVLLVPREMLEYIENSQGLIGIT